MTDKQKRPFRAVPGKRYEVSSFREFAHQALWERIPDEHRKLLEKLK